MIRNYGKQGLVVVDNDAEACNRAYMRHIGWDMFHGHLAALGTARTQNRFAGRKIKKVVFRKGHFMVVDA